MNLADRLVAIHEALDVGGVPHAFGGALALAWCTARPRATIDIDVNLFVKKADAAAALGSFPTGVPVSAATRRAAVEDGQVRLRWDDTPIDVFFSTTSFHDAAQQRVQIKYFAGSGIPFLACRDLAVFKAFFDRPQDWVDIEKMISGRTIDPAVVADTLARYVGADDHRVNRLHRM